MNKENIIIEKLDELNRKGYAFNGIDIVSGANSIEGDYFGFTISPTKPDTLKITPKNANLLVNGAAATIATDLVAYFAEGQFVPVEFTKMTLTGSGHVACYKK